VLLTPGPWIAAAIAVLLALPYAVWQVLNGWPTVEFIRRASADKMIAQAPWDFLMSQVSDMHPLTLPVWLGGLWFLLFDRRGRRYRSLGVMYLCVLALLIINSTSRPEYLSPAYTALFAGGAIWLEQLFARTGRILQPIAIAVLVAGGLITAPLAMPMLPVDTYVRYAAAMGDEPSTAEKKELGNLGQFYADRFGWDELVAAATQAYRSLTADEQRVAAIFTSNYGEAGAIDVLGRAAGLPFAISGHNNYWLWGPKGHTGDVVIALTPSRERLEMRFEDVRQVGTIDCRHCMPYQNHRAVFVCRRPRQTLTALWPQVKHFD
jgi:hypothetical protein